MIELGLIGPDGSLVQLDPFPPTPGGRFSITIQTATTDQLGVYTIHGTCLAEDGPGFDYIDGTVTLDPPRTEPPVTTPPQAPPPVEPVRVVPTYTG
jgi:hypothetical protein